MRKEIIIAGLVLLGGCWEDKPLQPERSAVPEAGIIARVQAAAEERIRSTARDGDVMRFRAVQIHRQALPQTFAVCGQATLSGGASFVPFVSVVTAAADDGFEIEQHVAKTNLEATRVYVELVARCFDGGGPVPRAGGPVVSQAPPPLPTGLPTFDTAPESMPEPPASLPATLVASSSPPPAGDRASGALLMRQHGNIRATPGGGGAVLRVARPGSTLQVFGTAPGGWYRVGDGAPEGWVHGSLATVQ
jgi:hypothetical protein